MININENIWSEAPWGDLLRLRRHMTPCHSYLWESGQKESRELKIKHLWIFEYERLRQQEDHIHKMASLHP